MAESGSDLQHNSYLLRTFVQRLPAAVAMLDRNMCYLEASDRWCTDYGITQGHIIGRSHYEIFPDLPDRWKEMHRRALAGETLRAEEELYVRTDGRLIWLHWEIQPWGERDGLPEGILIFTEDVTKRKEAEDAALATELRYHSLFQHSTQGIAYCQATGAAGPVGSFVYLDVNERFEEMFGMKELTGKVVNFSGGGPWTADPRLIETCDRVAQEGVSETLEISIKPQEKWFKVSAYCPQTGYFMAIFDDITERKQLEESLRKEHRRLEQIVATAPGAVYARRLSPDGKISLPYVSPVFKRMLPELPDLTDSAQPMFEMIHPDDAAEVRSSIAKSAEDLSPWRQVYRVVTGKRGTIWVDSYSLPQRDADGGVTWYGFLLDVTERRRTEESLAQAQQVLATLFDTASQAIMSVDQEGKIQMANRMTEEIFGYVHGELVGQAHEVLLPPHLQDKHKTYRQAFMSAPKRRPMGVGLELEARRKDGSLFPVEVSLSYVHNAQGILAVSFLTDITIRKQQELAIRQAEEERGRLNSALLAAEEETARKIARELHDDITQRMALLSIYMGKMASGLPASSDVVKELRFYQKQILEISEAIRKISHEMHPAILEELGLSAALESLCLDLQKSSSDMEVHFKARNVPAKIDKAIASCLYRVGQEATRNIAKHANAKDVSVVLSGEKDFLQLAVIDSGVGFDPTTQKTGLGTHSMKERLRLVNGTISLVSEPGEGTRIIARVPIVEISGG